jgi:carboxymethylenebutenolidase
MATSIEAEVYLAVADRDRTYPPEMAARFEEALETAGVRYRSELYADAAHGWMMPDFPVFNPSAAERGWSALFALFARNIRGELRDE